jgi:dolichyl-phosphate beta-glucosyltransferase
VDDRVFLGFARPVWIKLEFDMDATQKTAIIIPCYNESKRLKIYEFENYLSTKSGVSFIFVNDGSTDKTLEIINQLCLFAPQRVLCRNLEKNKGKAEAVRQGILMAVELGFKYIGYWDADLSTPLYLIDRLCEKLESGNVTIVMGSRVRILGCDINRRAARHYFGRVFATIASLILDLYVYDTQCGAKIFENNNELQKVFAHPFLVNWTFDVEILARFKVLRNIGHSNSLERTTLEYPLEEWADIGGSKLKFIDFFKASLELAKIYCVLNFPVVKKKYMEKFR